MSEAPKVEQETEPRRRGPKDDSVNLTGLDRLLSTASVAKALDISERQVRRFVSSGKFPPSDRRVGKAPRWRFSTVESYLNGESEDNESTLPNRS